MKVLGMCIDKKVVGGLAVVGLGIWWLAPGAIAAALPFLLLAICPLSMLFMMKAMNGMNGQQPTIQANGDAAQQTAPVPAAVDGQQLTLPVTAESAAETSSTN